MKLNRRSRRFHDPWGYNREGTVCGAQWMVGQEECHFTNGRIDNLDKSKSREATWDRFVKGKRSIEKVRQ